MKIFLKIVLTLVLAMVLTIVLHTAGKIQIVELALQQVGAISSIQATFRGSLKM